MISEYIFWISVGVILFVYLGYPLLLVMWGGIFGQKVKKNEFLPRVSILISAYNEEQSIGATIQNKLDLDYPQDKLEIIVVSDGSEDKTSQIVSKFSGKAVRLLEQKPRAGKTMALNMAVQEAAGEILVFSDANSIYDSGALKKLMQNFSDPAVGYVTGKMVYVDDQGSVIGSGCSAYMRYENFLRLCETRVGSVIGVDGGIDAVRKSLYEPMSAEMLPDFVLPLSVMKRHCRVVYEPAALLKENSLTEKSDEWKMRVRVTLRSYHALWTMKSLFNFFKYPVISVQLFFHKVLRYWVGFFQLIAFISNIFLLGQGSFYMGLFIMQIIFYGAAILGIKYVSYFCILNAAAMVAFFKFLNGEKQVLWNPRKG